MTIEKLKNFVFDTYDVGITQVCAEKIDEIISWINEHQELTLPRFKEELLQLFEDKEIVPAIWKNLIFAQPSPDTLERWCTNKNLLKQELLELFKDEDVRKSLMCIFFEGPPTSGITETLPSSKSKTLEDQRQEVLLNVLKTKRGIGPSSIELKTELQQAEDLKPAAFRNDQNILNNPKHQAQWSELLQAEKELSKAIEEALFQLNHSGYEATFEQLNKAFTRWKELRKNDG